MAYPKEFPKNETAWLKFVNKEKNSPWLICGHCRHIFLPPKYPNEIENAVCGRYDCRQTYKMNHDLFPAARRASIQGVEELCQNM